MDNNILINNIHGIYTDSCINCGGEIDDLRLSLGLPCQKCLPEYPPTYNLDDIYRYLTKNRKIRKRFRKIYGLYKDLERFEKLFEVALESRPWSAQRTWATRVFKGTSFSIVAPTGVGKTLFGMLMSIYLSGYKKIGKSIIIVPTTPLVEQIYERITYYTKKAGLEINIVAYHSKIRKRRSVIRKLMDGEYDILVATSQFISRSFHILEKQRFYFIFVDDVDAILKSSKNIDRILKLLGFKEEEIKLSLETIKLRSSLIRIKEQNERKKIVEEIRRNEKILKRHKSRDKGVLIVSSATGRPRGIRVKIFRELLGFQIGYRSETLRNIVDTYIIPRKERLVDILIRLIKRLGNGGLIYVPVDKGIEQAYEITNILLNNGIKADVFTSGKLDVLERFINGELDVIVGVAIYYGVMVRGIDLPDRIRYAIFVGIPRFKFNARFEEPHPIQILRTLAILRDIVEDKSEIEKIDEMSRVINRIVKTGTLVSLRRLSDVLKGEEEARTRAEKMALEALKYIRTRLEDTSIREKLKKLEGIQVLEENGEFYIMIPDLMTYIQASGRTSRLYAGGITKGLSIILVDYENLLDGLIRKMRWIIEDSEWREYEEIDLESILEEIDYDRLMVKMVRTGEIKKKIEDPVKTVLMIVESPNKARTISRFFGKPTIRKRDNNIVYEVSIGNLILMITASGGHVYNLITLPRKEEKENNIWYGVYLGDNNMFIPIYNSIKRCLNCGHQFTSRGDSCPKCGSREIHDTINRVKFLRDLATEVDEVYIATDPDVEGEKIGWDIAVLLRPYTKNIYRLEFHEITRKAILKALKEKRPFNIRFIEAQIVRRIEDRWIGFVLSGKLKTEFREIIGDKKWYKYRKGEWSAGRVQTPVLGWIIERWDKVLGNRKEVVGFLLPDEIYFEIKRDDLPDRYRLEPEKISFRIQPKEKRVEIINPPPPFTTDTLIQEANRTLKLGADEIMRLAQDLFEQGLITYHRTDSNRVSDTGINLAREYLKIKYKEEADLIFKPRKWGVGGAHECIRPTRPLDTDTLIKLVTQGDLIFGVPLTKNHYRLYSLIFNRFIASQMIPSKVIRQEVEVFMDNNKIYVEDRVIEIIEQGFFDIYGHIKTRNEVSQSKICRPISVDIKMKYLIPGYTQGDVIRLMREKEIGRPSTYAKILKTLITRKYVFESKKARWLIPREKGRIVFEYLSQRYGDLVSEDRTRLMEKYMREIEDGRRNYIDILRELYEEVRIIEEPPIEVHEVEEDLLE
jgi:reverse gyrase